ncbi:MAG TPA: PP2C family protein-serine/threonine phosphatase [Candidatus Acidoferrales bacterium]|nr:PP2C family protein-serine/threonine phosphatase [Candidatus Acidoferrales bacterium]
MSATGPAYSPAQGPPPRSNRVRGFWERVTEGRNLDQLWGQMKADARATYSFYSREVDWEAMGNRKGLGRALRVCWAFFTAMLMKLSPARRVALLIAIVLLIVHVNANRGNAIYAFDFSGIGVAILFLLLALELADRVTMKRDLEIARDIQRWLVPDKPPVVPGVDIAFATRPQNTVAGDYYDAFMRPGPEGAAGQVLLMVVADVAGKSVPAALLMATFQASVHSLAARPGSLDELARELNHYACDHSLSGMRFTTAFLAEWDPAARQLRYVNAGHNAPFLRRTSGTVERLGEGSLPFGISNAAEYKSVAVRIIPDELLVIFTDGLAEAVNASGQEYGEPRLENRVASFTSESAAAALSALMGDVDAYVGQARQHDDITCLAARFS